MRQILLTYHVKAREEIICNILAETIKKNDPKVDVVIGEYYSICRDMYKYNPEVIYTMFPRDDYSAFNLTILKLITNAHVIAVPTEGLMSFDRESMKRVVGFNSYSKNLVDEYFVWGNNMKEGISPILFEQNKIHDISQIKIFGYLPYEKDSVKKCIKEEVENNADWARMMGEFEKKATRFRKIVMYIMGFHNADITIEQRKIEGYFENCSEDEIDLAERKSNANVYYKKCYFEGLKKCIEQFPDTLFVLKLHPVEIEDYFEKGINIYSEFEKYENVFLIYKPIPISIFFERIDLLVHYGSTTGLEGYIYEIPTIQLLNDFSDLSGGGMGLLYFDSTYTVPVSDYQAILNLLGKDIKFSILPKTESMLNGMMNYFSTDEYHPSEKLATSILKKELETKTLSCSEKEVKKAVFSKVMRGLLLHWNKDLLKSLIQRDFRNAFTIFKYKCKLIKKIFN